MSNIHTATGFVTVRTDLGQNIPTEQLRRMIDAALILVQYVADAFGPIPFRNVELVPGGSANRQNSGFESARDRARNIATALAVAGEVAAREGTNVMRRQGVDDFVSAALRAADYAGALSVILDRARTSGSGLASIPGALADLGDFLRAYPIAGLGFEELYGEIVDGLVDTRLFVEVPSSTFAGVIGLSYRNPLEIAIEIAEILAGGASVTLFVAGLRIMFGAGPAERAGAKKTKAEARIADAQAQRIEIDNQELQRQLEAAIERPVAPIDERTASAARTVRARDWTFEME